MKRERWTEADIDTLPLGEHDYFERKSGQTAASADDLKGALAKASSAFANSGGGHLLLGVDNSGVPDGVPRTQGNTPFREWIEQTLPTLVAYPLSDFRVHVVERSAASRIPADKDVVVVDIGDSALAPHQCAYGGGGAQKYTYYHRQAGHSVPAPHFYLELLRQRLVNPVLELADCEVQLDGVAGNWQTLATDCYLAVKIENKSRVTAYKWRFEGRVSGMPELRTADVKVTPSPSGGIQLDKAILPGDLFVDRYTLTFTIRPKEPSFPAITEDARELVSGIGTGVPSHHRVLTRRTPKLCSSRTAQY